MDINANPRNQALHLSGNSYLVLSDPGLSASYTKEVWIKLDHVMNLGYYQNVISGTAAYPHFLTVRNNKVMAGHNQYYETTEGIQDKDTIQEGVWIHFAVTYEWTTKTMTLYRNGQEVARNTTIPQVLQTESGEKTILIGSYNQDFKFKGLVDEVRVWNYARDAEDIAP